MKMTPDPQAPATLAFTFHDVADFPLVISRTEVVARGYSGRWAAEMTALIDCGRPFVIVFPGPLPEETPDDRKQRSIWLKHNKTRLARVCRALIRVEPDGLKRGALKAQAFAMTKAFGIPMEVVATRTDAIALAATLAGR